MYILLFVVLNNYHRNYKKCVIALEITEFLHYIRSSLHALYNVFCYYRLIFIILFHYFCIIPTNKIYKRSIIERVKKLTINYIVILI